MMTPDNWASLAYLGLLGAALVSWYILQNRRSLGTVAKQAGAWAMIFLGVIAVVGLWDDIRQTARPAQAVFAPEGRVEIPRSHDGHYYLTLLENDAPIRLSSTLVQQGLFSASPTRSAGGLIWMI